MATYRTWSRSRTRRGSGNDSTLLSIDLSTGLERRPPFSAFEAGTAMGNSTVAGASDISAELGARLASLTPKPSSTR